MLWQDTGSLHIPEKEVLENIKALNAEFVAQNVFVKEDALMEGAPSYDEESGLAFKPYTVKKLGDAELQLLDRHSHTLQLQIPKRFYP